MIKTKKRIYILIFIILGLALLGSAVIIWDVMGNYGKQQDKVYSGAKLVYSIIDHPLKIG
ncbi:MAG TPA: hypothetical protein VFD89_09630 [Clostridia bacterium]|nr:hypothetical protein [Clostridia bacterium]